MEITLAHLKAIAGIETKLMPFLVEWINKTCPKYEIDSAQELSHFLAQACHESDHFKTTREYASGSAYEGRKDLGNIFKGDGPMFRGRGIFQITGRSNYLSLGIKKGDRMIFIEHPELLETPEYAIWSACEYWKGHKFNDIANMGDDSLLKKKYHGTIIDISPVEYISISINGGYNGMEERKKFYERAKAALII